MIDRGTCKAMLRESARLMLEQADRLSDIDSKFGDGDHGITITKIAKRAEAWDEESIKDFLDDLGMAAMAVRGGSAGPLYGTMIGGLGARLEDDENELSADAARRMFAGCLAEMQDITNAQVGDKTMMDALIPAVEAAQACDAADDDAAAVFAAAAEGAEAGARASPPSSAARAVTATPPSARPTREPCPRRCSCAGLQREPRIIRQSGLPRRAAGLSFPAVKRLRRSTMQMKKFINDPENLTAELLEGLALANPDILELGEDNMVINKKLAEADRVTIVTQGGSGHEPAIEGFVGEGMVDIDVVGDIFAAPGPQACVDAIKLADKGKGVLYIVLNHAGDMLTGNMTMKQCKKQGLNVVKVVTQEDVSNAPRENADDRRGLVGCIPTYKIAGAAAAEGRSLEEVAAVAQRFADNMATLAVAVRGATHPQTGTLLAELGDDEMEIGMGQHGEEGGGRQPMKSADETAAIMVNALAKDIGIQPGEKVMLIINGSGATTLMEQLIVYRAAVKELAKQDIEVVANFVGEMLTVQEQAGFQMFMARMDDELLRLWNAPCTTPYLKK